MQWPILPKVMEPSPLIVAARKAGATPTPPPQSGSKHFCPLKIWDCCIALHFTLCITLVWDNNSEAQNPLRYTEGA